MKVLFAVSSEKISDTIVKRYQKEYREILSYKNVFYFNAILKELQKDKTYDRIVISEDLEQFSNTNYDQIDKKIFDRLDNISDEAEDINGTDTPIILICSDRHTKGSSFLVKIFGIGIYNALLGGDRKIQDICKLINKPRMKKEAKQYYRIDAEDVNYSKQSDKEVDENQIINITNYFKRLGKNTSKYAESFEKIANDQGYTQEQLKIIVNCLPTNVRKVLGRESLTYQKLMNITTTGDADQMSGEELEQNTGIKVDLLNNLESNVSGPIVIPSSVKTSKNKKIPSAKKVDSGETLELPNIENKSTKVKKVVKDSKEESLLKKKKKKHHVDEDDDLDLEFDPIVEEPTKLKKKKKKKIHSDVGEEGPISSEKKKKKKKKKHHVVEEDDDLVSSIGDLDEFDDEEDMEIPGHSSRSSYDDDDDDDDINLPGMDNLDDIDEEASLLSFDESEEDEDGDDEKPKSLKSKVDYSMSNLNSLLTKDKKIVTFVGTTKNGTSFLVNNLATLFSSLGINTAILDMTTNRNAYYMYTNNEESLRNIALNSISKLQKGFAEGIQVNKNLVVYTSLPNDGKIYDDAEPILSTLVQNHSLILIDCDFSTSPAYFASCQEIYLVQSMDVNTIQPLTAFLRDLKAKGVLESERVRVVVNKEIAVKNFNTKAIINGMSFYNDPSMSFMTELFNKDLVKAYTIPFEEKVYSKYLDSIATCNISLNGYTKTFNDKLKTLGGAVYPLVGKVSSGGAESIKSGFGKGKKRK